MYSVVSVFIYLNILRHNGAIQMLLLLLYANVCAYVLNTKAGSLRSTGSLCDCDRCRTDATRQ